MGSMSIMHWAIVAAVIALLFGRNKISGLMEDVAHGIKSFKKGMQDEPIQGKGSENDVHSASAPSDRQ